MFVHPNHNNRVNFGVKIYHDFIICTHTFRLPVHMHDVLIIIALILLNGVFSMSEIALISARKSRLASDAKQGSRGARAALQLADDPDRFLSTIQIGITLIGILTGLYSGAALSEDVANILSNIGLDPKISHTIGQIAIVIVVTYLSIVVCELVPKRIGHACANSASKLISRPMRLLSIVAMPAVWLLSVSTSLIVKLINIRQTEKSVTEEEIKSLIRDGTDAGEVRKVEQNIMERALIMGDLRISSLMTPKIDISTFTLDMSAEQIRLRLADDLHNCYPVYCDKSAKTICGIVTLKQLILTLDKPDFCLADVVTAPQYFPSSMNVYDTLEHMKSMNIHFAVICDEFGDMAGVITPSDILKGLVGTLTSESPSSYIIKTDSGDKWSVSAKIPFYDFLSQFNLEHIYRPASYSTLGGFILEQLKYVPRQGDKLIWNNLSFEISSMDGAKINRVNISPCHSGNATTDCQETS